MKKSLIYIFSLICLFGLYSCSMNEDLQPAAKDGKIVFNILPAEYTGKNAATKAVDADLLENKINTAFFFLFDNDGNLVYYVDLQDKITAGTAANNYVSTIAEHEITPDKNLTSATICYLTNVTPEYAEAITELSDLTVTLSGYSVDNDTIIPTDMESLPMASLKTGLDLSKPGTIEVEDPLQRIFSKVVVNLSLDVSSGILGFESASNAYFRLKNYTLSNLPTSVNVRDENTSPSLENITVDLSDAAPEIYDADNTNTANIKSWSFVCYVPEYYPAADKKVHLTMNGLFHKPDNSFANVKYEIDLGASSDGSIRRNNQYSHKLTITGTDHLTSGGDGVEILPLNLVDAYGQAANCYIISTAGTYELDAYMGAFPTISDDTPIASGTPVLVWTDKANTISFNKDTSTDTKVVFDINPDGAALASGNSVIAIEDANGNVLWSWHLWFAPGTTFGLGDLEEQTYQQTEAVLLNRNLGSSSATESGAYYKWGYKEPFFDGDYQGNGISDTYSWSGDGKQRTDPCPPGYKVPSTDVWLSEDNWKTTTAASTQTTQSFSYDINPSISYPYSGYWLAGVFESTYTIDKEYSNPDFSYISTGLNGQDKYSDMTLSISMNAQFGSIWANDKFSLLYGYASVPWSSLAESITIVKCKKEYRTMKTEFVNWRPVTTYGEWQDKGYVTGGDLSTNDKAQLLATLVAQGGVITEVEYEIKTETNPDIGLQVRCVKE